MKEENLGPTGAILNDLPSPYIPHPATGLLHLPRFIAKIQKDLKGELPASYQRNYCRGFDRFLCMHLGIDPQQVVGIVKAAAGDPAELDARLMEILPEDLNVAKWNRELVQKGMSELGRETLKQAKDSMDAGDREDILSFADVIDLDEGRIP